MSLHEDLDFDPYQSLIWALNRIQELDTRIHQLEKQQLQNSEIQVSLSQNQRHIANMNKTNVTEINRIRQIVEDIINETK